MSEKLTKIFFVNAVVEINVKNVRFYTRFFFIVTFFCKITKKSINFAKN